MCWGDNFGKSLAVRWVDNSIQSEKSNFKYCIREQQLYATKNNNKNDVVDDENKRSEHGTNHDINNKNKRTEIDMSSEENKWIEHGVTEIPEITTDNDISKTKQTVEESPIMSENIKNTDENEEKESEVNEAKQEKRESQQHKTNQKAENSGELSECNMSLNQQNRTKKILRQSKSS